jgi:hypothetical protein
MADLVSTLTFRQHGQFPNEKKGLKSSEMGRTGYVARIEDMRNAYIIFIGNVKVRYRFGNIG